MYSVCKNNCCDGDGHRTETQTIAIASHRVQEKTNKCNREKEEDKHKVQAANAHTETDKRHKKRHKHLSFK